MISPENSVSATIEGNVIDIIYAGRARNPHSIDSSLCYLCCVVQPVAYCSVFGPQCKHFALIPRLNSWEHAQCRTKAIHLNGHTHTLLRHTCPENSLNIAGSMFTLTWPRMISSGACSLRTLTGKFLEAFHLLPPYMIW